MRLWPWTREQKPVPANPPAQTVQGYEHYDAYSQLLDRNGQWIGVADTKAGAILAFTVAAFPLFALPALPVLQRIIKVIPPHTTFWGYVPTVSIIGLLALFSIAVLMTLLCVLMALTPRLTRRGKAGLIFFGDIAQQEYSQWEQSILRLSPQLLACQVLEQVYTTAWIATRKHVYVRRAIHTLIGALVLGFVLAALCQFLS